MLILKTPDGVTTTVDLGQLLTAACIKTGRPQIARKAIELAESRLLKDGWPEYYDGKLRRYVRKQARKHQTWSIAGYLVAKMLLEDLSHLGMILLEDDRQLKPIIKQVEQNDHRFWSYNQQQINRVGHTGTLDPMATGLLIVCIGKATKLVDRFQGMVKGYSGVLQLGEATSTLDADSRIKVVVFYLEVGSFTALLNRPSFYEFALLFFFLPKTLFSQEDRQNVVFRVTCSKGTYIQSLCADFAKALNSCAHMTVLRRDSIGKTSFDFNLFLSYLTCHMFDLKYKMEGHGLLTWSDYSWTSASMATTN
ncbi:hypothetical protein LXL04_025699 [Taraxacum kok-saghyz]